MKLHDIEVGNGIKYFTGPNKNEVVAFKVSDDVNLEMSSVFILGEYFLMHPEHNVYPISKIEQFNLESIRETTKSKISNNIGNVVWNYSGVSHSRLLITSNKFKSAFIVSEIDNNLLLNWNIEVINLGRIINFDGLNMNKKFRICPNCSMRLLVNDNSKNIDGFDTVGRCKHCGCLIGISWSDKDNKK